MEPTADDIIDSLGCDSARPHGVKMQHLGTEINFDDASKIQLVDSGPNNDYHSLDVNSKGAGPYGDALHFDCTDSIVIIHYNVHSLINFEDRMERIMLELKDQQWDVLVFSETWREETSEAWSTTHGHAWFGSGGIRGQTGVGFLLNGRWRHTAFKPISNRVAFLDVQIAKGLNMRVFGVYMPHSLMPDEDVEGVYASIEGALKQARHKGYRSIIAGDFNTEVGCRTEGDDPSIIGENPMTARSSRGDLLVKWCTFHGFVIANSFGCKDFASGWTFKNGAQLKHLDYILADTVFAKQVLSCQVLECLDIGSDHRALALTLTYDKVKNIQNTRKRKAIPAIGSAVLYTQRLYIYIYIYIYRLCGKAAVPLPRFEHERGEAKI